MAKKINATETTEQAPVNTFSFLPADLSVGSAPLSALVALDTTPIENARLAMRETNEQHIEHIKAAIAEGKKLPPLRVVNSTLGLVVLDGYHRWGAYEMFLRETLESDPSYAQSVESLQAARQNFFVPIMEENVVDDIDALKKAFAANLEHGLPASNASRSRYALWLLEQDRIYAKSLTDEARAAYAPMSIREASRQAQVSHVAVMKAAKKLLKQDKMKDTFGDDERAEADALEAEESAESKTADKQDKQMMAVVRAVKAIQELNAAYPDYNDMQSFMSAYTGQLTQEQCLEAKDFFSELFQRMLSAETPVAQKQLVK